MKPRTSVTGPKTAEDETPPPQVAATHYIGPYQLSAANGTHYPGRCRIVVVGPTSEGLIQALAAALDSFSKQPKP